MADFQLELDVFASTSKLEADLKRAEQAVGSTAEKIDKMSGDGGGFGKFTIGAGKAAAAFGAIEIAAGAISTIGQGLKGVVASFSGETEKAERAFAGALEAAKQLPFGIGGTIDKVNQLALALAGVEDTLVEIAELEADIRAYEARKATVLNVLRTMRDIREEQELQLELLKEEDDARREILSIELDMVRQVEQLKKKRDEALAAGVAEDIVLENYARTYDVIQKIRNERIRQIEAEQKAASLAEEQAKQMERQAKAAEEMQKSQERQLAFVNARLKMEQEISEARAEAERQAAGATATFATAGGSFTTAASAQVNEAKLLTKISQQSRDFLAMIMQNTARMAGGLNLA